MSKHETDTQFVVQTDKYGVVESKLQPGFTEGAGSIEHEYQIENIPQSILDISREIASLGGRALLVGGSVRDMVIAQEFQDQKIKPKDFDIEIYGLSPDDLQKILNENFGAENVDPVGKAFGILKVRIDGWDEPLDFSIPRTESKKGEGHKGFEVTGIPGMVIREAAKRRDITINSLAYDPLTAIVYDPYGGIQDIKDKVIRMTDENAFKEDPLRVIRVMQFAARFDFKVDAATEAVCADLVATGKLNMRQNVIGAGFVEGEWTAPNQEGFYVVHHGNQITFDKPPTPSPETQQGFFVVDNDREIYKKPTPELPGLPRERVTEELFKLFLKSKHPSVGFEFARRIGLLQLYWPDLYKLVGLKQELKWHPEEDTWEHVMQVVDGLSRIADEEIEAGRLPTPGQWQELEDKITQVFNFERDRILLELYRDELIPLIGEDALREIENAALKLGQEKAQSHLAKIYKRDNQPPTERQIRIRKAEASSLEEGTRSKYLKRKILEQIENLRASGVLSEERIQDLESVAESQALEIVSPKRKFWTKELKNSVKIVLILAGLNHDDGKPLTTFFDEGAGIIRSPNHEPAGIAPTRRVLDTLDETRFSPDLKKQILPLVGEHLQPREIWAFYTDEGKITELTPAQKKELNHRLVRLATRLYRGDDGSSFDRDKKSNYPDGGGTNLYFLGLVAKGDFLGRNAEGRPFSDEEKYEQLAWYRWWMEQIADIKIVEEAPKIIDGDDILKALGKTKKEAGPWMRVIIDCVTRDMQDGLLSEKEADLLQAAIDYYHRLNIFVTSQMSLQTEAVKNMSTEMVWSQLLKTDARVLLSSSS